MSDVFSDLAADLPPVTRLALAYSPPRARARTLALLALDERMARMLRGGREPVATQLRLAWWRETLQQPQAQWPYGDRALDALRTWLDAAVLTRLVDGWEALLAERLAPPEIAEFVDGRGQAFAALATELGTAAADDALGAGRLWALADLAAHISDGEERRLVIDYGRALPPPPRLPASLRPLAVLAGLGMRALERDGAPLLTGPGSALLALRIGLSGQ